MTQREQARLQVLNSLLAEHMTLEQAATLMGVSTRHTRRILAAYREEGAAALAHGHRGRRAPNATPEPTRSEVLRLARSRYSETNHTHLSELLGEREGIEIGRTTLRRILTSAGLRSPRHRRPPRHRVRRQRMPREGMLVQVDGSHHRWLGDHGPPFALLLAVDDATGIVANALFCEQENTRDYFLLIRGLIQRFGIPIALYTDRHSVFKNVPGAGRAGAPTQFSRAMDELGVQMVFALSPQAKGRVERTAGTFQDRLVTELRLAGATTIEEANVVLKDFLDRFNERFGVAAQHPEAGRATRFQRPRHSWRRTPGRRAHSTEYVRGAVQPGGTRKRRGRWSAGGRAGGRGGYPRPKGPATSFWSRIGGGRDSIMLQRGIIYLCTKKTEAVCPRGRADRKLGNLNLCAIGQQDDLSLDDIQAGRCEIVDSPTNPYPHIQILDHLPLSST